MYFIRNNAKNGDVLYLLQVLENKNGNRNFNKNLNHLIIHMKQYFINIGIWKLF